MTFKIHTQESAPEGSKHLLDSSQKALGMIPQYTRCLAEAPQVLEAYQLLDELSGKSSFSAEEITVVWQTVNVENECHYCVPAHTAIGHMMKVDSIIIDALRTKTRLSD